MLVSLRVKNYALINELSVNFQGGLNIITGETGAGKSILLGALGLILGKRADLSVLMNRDNKCIVEAEFEISNYNLHYLFDENDVDYEDHAVFRREILPSGKSRAFVNDTPVTLVVMQKMALNLVDIHSQHQNLLLNEQEFILGLIDRYCRNNKLLEEYTNFYTSFKDNETLYLSALKEHNLLKEQFDYLSFQFKELEDAKLNLGELDQLEKDLNALENAGEIKTVLHEVEDILNSDDNGIIAALNIAVQRLSKISPVYDKAENFLSRIESSMIELKDLSQEISGTFENLEFDPDRFNLYSERLNVLNSILLKYKKSNINDLIHLRDELGKKVSTALEGDFELNKIKEELEESKNLVVGKAKEISDKRQKAFPGFEAELLAVLKELGMEHSRIKFENVISELTHTGIDILNLQFSANKNHPLQEVSKIASGGELSRLMLGIKSVLSNTVGMPTLLLDEIDAGVSGDIADKVGKIIYHISEGLQVINITHLPQVASKGNSHFLVYKDHNQDVTNTLIKPLSKEERLKEIAKMLSGEGLTEAALENARVLLGF